MFLIAFEEDNEYYCSIFKLSSELIQDIKHHSESDFDSFINDYIRNNIHNKIEINIQNIEQFNLWKFSDFIVFIKPLLRDRKIDEILK